jgi:tRNA nucleotidyltransferase (CCA-adding enzyme)
MNKKKKSIGAILSEQISLIRPEKEEEKVFSQATKDFTSELKKELKKNDNVAEVFVSGSFAKGTMVRKDQYDIDILLRFDWQYDNISDISEKVLKNLCKRLDIKLERVHGSRDYFKAYHRDGGYFEIIPVTKIKKPNEEKNVTDLSYFHVPYVKKKIKGLEDELRLAKTFCYAQNVYGAETYVRGFSGYALELLIIKYRSFTKMLRELSKVKLGERLIIDIEKKYKRKNDVFIELNENKLHSPVILIDPTYKERNALAALGYETFRNFQKAARGFLKRPNKSYFVEKSVNIEELKRRAKKNKADFLRVRIKTDKQEGDIAGTKLKKFHYLLENELRKYFKLIHHEFHYDEKQGADIYMIVKSRKEVVHIGPPLRFKKHVQAFKKEHRDTYEKNKFVHARIKVTFSAKGFVDAWRKQRTNKRMMKEMGITGLKILNKS